MRRLPKSTGLFETHLTVSDLERSIAFYRDVVGLPVALELEDHRAAFFWIGAPGEAMLGLRSIGSAPLGTSHHIALTVSLADVLDACDALRSNGITPLSFFGSETAEPSVIGWMPAATVCFRDPDGHLIEYLAMLEEPARAEDGIVPWSEWASHHPAAEAVHVELYTGQRGELRALFEEAEDSGAALDAYIDAGAVLVAVVGGRVVGQLQLIDDPADDASEIKNMAVEATYRGRGIGRALIEAAKDMTQARGISTLVVGTAAADIGNLRFYQHLGFRMRDIERDAFLPEGGYPTGMMVDGIRLRDRVWLELELLPGDVMTDTTPAGAVAGPLPGRSVSRPDPRVRTSAAVGGAEAESRHGEPPRVELAGAECVDEVRALWLELHRHERDVAPDLPIVTDDERSWRQRRSMYVRWLELDQGFLVLARNRSGVVGYAVVRLEEGSDDTFPVGERYAELYSLSVTRARRGEGIGTALLDFVDAELASRGIRDLAVAVMIGNSDAQRLYEGRGLRPAEILLYRFGSDRRSG